MTKELHQLIGVIQRNCTIADARHAREMSLCTYLLEMREFYRWEQGIPLGETMARGDVGAWLSEREALWETLAEENYDPLPVAGEEFDPFASVAINQRLAPHGLVYGAGIGRFGKPHFFLGQLEHSEQHDGITVHVSSCEYARDLVAPPAMLLDNTVYLRQESMRRAVWEQIEEWRWNHQGNQAMTRALTGFDLERDPEGCLDHFTRYASRIAILHETGEAQAERLLGEAWPRMLASVSRRKAEFQARAVRDLLADCLTTLPGLLKQAEAPAIHFFFAGFSGLRRHLFPEALTAYQAWLLSNDTQTLEQLAQRGVAQWLDVAQRMLALHAERGVNAGPFIESLLECNDTCITLPVH